ncbi:unnamed protein product [Leptidea sinapis]|uniref:Lipid-binding serum glycoprotein N-terminal domain-containing protein n=1 Tax=Leptidea sinapis TaxID=189913 RepID=A0A5E4PZR6_9NEOP|nr:unnamed protein product [Leptidea sinapis]
MLKSIVKFVLVVSLGCVLGKHVSKDGTDDKMEQIAQKPVCHYSDPGVSGCIIRVAEQARKLLAHGIQSFGIQPLEPLKIPSIRLRQHNMPQNSVYPDELRVSAYCTAALEAVGAKVHKRIVIKDANVKMRCTGPVDASLKEAHSTTGEMAVETALSMVLEDIANKFLKHVPPNMNVVGLGSILLAQFCVEFGKEMKGHYSMKGQILMLPVEGDGEFTAKYGNIDATVTIKLGRRPRANSSDALSCEDLHVKFHIGQASMHLGSLFGGNAMNKFFNDNWEPISEELREPMEEALKDFLRPLADHTFGILDADDILLPDDTDKETSDKKH